MLKAVLFDHDGVLADSEALFFEVNKQVFVEYEIELTHELWGSLYLSEGLHTRELAKRVGIGKEHIETLLERRNEIYHRRRERDVGLMNGVRAAVEALGRKYRLTIVTGCPRRQIDAIHGSGVFLDNFDLVLTADDCMNSKPNPEPYLKAMDMLDLVPEDCVAVEDSPRGVRAAHDAGLRCILIPTPLTVLELCPPVWHVCDDMRAAADFIAGLT